MVVELNINNFYFYDEIDKNKNILFEMRKHKKEKYYNELKIVIEIFRDVISSFYNNKYKLKQIKIDGKFLYYELGVYYLLLPELNNILKGFYGHRVNIIHDENLVGTNNLFEFDFINAKSRNLIKPF